MKHKPHYTKIISLKSETTELESISSGGLIGIGTEIDPYYCKNDNMIGMIAGLKGTLPPVYYDITIIYNKINFDETETMLFKRKKMVVIVGTNNIEGEVVDFDDTHIKLILHKPVCISDDSIIILCDKSSGAFQIVYYGYLEQNDYEFESQIVFVSEIAWNNDNI